MIYSTLNKPSDNMNLSNHELVNMMHEQQQNLYLAEQEAKIREQGVIDREREEYYAQMQSYLGSEISTRNRADYLQSVKESFLSECMMKLYSESVATKMSQRDTVIAKNLINGFIKENGVNNLLINFRTKNYLLSEMARICNKYYDQVLENCSISTEPGEVAEWGFDKTIKDNFYNELITLDTSDAGKLIRDRVADSIQEFIDSNTTAKLDYEDIIQTAQDKIVTAKSESAAEEYSSIAQRKINDMKQTRDKNVFNVMVESLTSKALTDQSYGKMFINESKVDMDGIVDNTTLIYTMLEMVNTTNMVNVNENFISDYLASLV